MTKTLPVLTVCLLAVATAMADDWPQWRGPDRTDISKETGLLKTWPQGGPKLLWTYEQAGIGYSGISIVGKRLYTMGGVDKEIEYVCALDAQTGQKVWSTSIGDFLTNGYGSGPRATPTVDGDFLYVIGGKGNLVCVETATGKKVWTVSLTKDLGGSVPGWGYCESPLVDGEWVLCSPGGNKGGIAALDKRTGKVVWQSADLKDRAGYSSIIIGEVGGVKQYINLTMSGAVGVRAKDGKLLWNYPQPKFRTAVIPTPIFHNDHVYITSGYGAGCDLIKLESESEGGTKATKVYHNDDMTNHHGGVIKIGDHIYGYSDRGGWMCMDMKSGEVVWKDRGIGKGCVTYADGKFYCYSEGKGEVALVEMTPQGKYKEVSKFTIPKQTKLPRGSGRIWTHPTVANGKLYLRDQDLIFCYDLKGATSK